MIIDLDAVARAIEEVAQTEIAPRFGRLKSGDIDTKTGPNDFVTEADRAAEKALSHAFANIYPGAAFIGEEAAAADPSILDALKGEGAFWIVDPLDGTRNFIQGRDEFGTIVALVENREIRAGWIYAIPDKAFAMASAGDGATWGGERLASLPAPKRISRGYRAIGNLNEPWKSELVPKLRATFATEPARCSAYAYIHMARGRADFGLYSRCSPWDHAAGALTLRELGGKCAYLDDGSPYAPVATQGRPMLSAGTAEAWERVRDALIGAGG